MKILIIGGNGMLGHQFTKSLSKNHDVMATLRNGLDAYESFNLFSKENSYSNIDIRSLDSVIAVFKKFNPHTVINCSGVTKQLASDDTSAETIMVNSLFPHQLVSICTKYNSRLIQLSTDCIYSGAKGFYKEEDISDALDLYGRSKFLGEVNLDNVITLRKSTIGLELGSNHGLIEWFLKQRNSVKGYTKAIYSGFTSMVLAEVVENIIVEQKSLSGIWNLASSPISKFDLLNKLLDRLDKFEIEIVPDDKININRSLDPGKFHEVTGFLSPSWDDMLDQLAEEINKRNK